MKKTIKIIVIILIAAVIITAGVLLYINYYNNSHFIDAGAAKEIAAADAGVVLTEARFTECKLETENRTKIYEIEVTSGATEYEYKLDAVSGNILWKESGSAFD